MYDSRFFKLACGGVVGVFSLAVVAEAVDGHKPSPHVESNITQPTPGVFGTLSASTSSGTLIG